MTNPPHRTLHGHLNALRQWSRAALVVLICILSRHSHAAADTVRITSDDGSVSISVPADWRADLKPNRPRVKLAIYSPPESSADHYIESIYIESEQLKNDDTLERYVEWFKAHMATAPGVSFVSESTVTANGLNGMRVLFRLHAVNRLDVVVMRYFFVGATGTVYMVNAVTLQADLDSWQQKLEEICLSVSYK